MSMADFHGPQDLILMPFLRCRCNTSYSVDGAGRDHILLAFVTAIPNSPCAVLTIRVSQVLPPSPSSFTYGQLPGRAMAWALLTASTASTASHSCSASPGPFLFSFPRSIPVQLPPGRVQLPPTRSINEITRVLIPEYGGGLWLTGIANLFCIAPTYPVRYLEGVCYGKGGALSV